MLEIRNPGWAEMVVAALLLAAMMAGQVLICHRHVLYHDGIWVDEYFTYLIASDPNPDSAVAALRQGLDGSPPVYHAIMRGVHGLLRGNPLVDYRAASTAAIWLALLALYGTLRYAVNAGAAAAAVLAVWTHPMTVFYAFDARPYALWFAGAACVAWALRMRSSPRHVLLFIAAAFTCTVHYFGILSVYLLLAGELLSQDGAWRQRVGRILPGVLGSLALLPMVPLMIAQHRALTPGWAPPFTPILAGHIIEEVFYSPALILIVIAWWISRYVENHPPARPRFSALAALFTLCCLPVFLFGCSAIGESVMVDRYFLVTILGMAAIFAVLLAESAAWIVVVLAATFLIFSTLVMHTEAATKRQWTGYYQQMADTAEQPGNSYALLFPTRHGAFEMWFEHPELRGRIAMMDLSGVPVSLPRDVAFEQRIQLATQRDYDLPPMWDIWQMPGLQFKFIGDPDLLQAIRNAIPLTEIDQKREIYQYKP